VKGSPTKLSLDYLRAHGWTVEVVEKWTRNPATGVQIKHDLFNLFDILGVKDDVTIAVQTTTKHNIGSRLKKIAADEVTAKLHRAGWLLVCHGWWQPGGPGTRYHVEEVVVADEAEQLALDAAVRRHPSG
jgi:hypothetical protein